MADIMNININKFKFTLKLIGLFFLKTNKTSNQTTYLEFKCYLATKLAQVHYLDNYCSSVSGSLFCQFLIDCAIISSVDYHLFLPQFPPRLMKFIIFGCST